MPQKVYAQLVTPDVEEVQEVVTEVERESLNDQRIVEVGLGPVVLDVGRFGRDRLEDLIEDHGDDALHDRRDDAHHAIEVEEVARLA